MTDKRQVKQNIHRLQRVKTWQLLVILLILGFVAATFLRINNVGMVQRRDAVLAADKVGDTNDIIDRLYELQQYTNAHMNAGSGAFYLEYQYKREAQRRVDAASQYTDQNGNVNIKADAICKPRYTVWSPAYVQCFTDELAKFPPSPDPVQNVILPSTSEYRYSYASPLWSADFAGWTIMLCGLIVLVIVVRLASLGMLHLLLKRHYKSI